MVHVTWVTVTVSAPAPGKRATLTDRSWSRETRQVVVIKRFDMSRMVTRDGMGRILNDSSLDTRFMGHRRVTFIVPCPVVSIYFHMLKHGCAILKRASLGGR
jgi:hypothetical protein